MTEDCGGASVLRSGAVAVLAALQELVLPVPCTGCGVVGPAICAACRGALLPAPALRLVGSPPLRVWSGLRYEGVARHVVLAFKNEGRTEFGRPLGAALLAALEVAVPALGDGPIEVVPMPSTIRSSRDRGYDPVRVVLRRAGLPYRRLLRLERRGADQRILGRMERLANAAGSMRSEPSAGVRVLLVDDVVTTGATLAEAARAIRHQGGTVLGAITVASTPERSASAS